MRTNQNTEQENQNQTYSRNLAQSLFSGIVAGFPPALLSRPILVITSPMHIEMKKSAYEVTRAIYRAYGWRGFANGLMPSLIASVPGTPLMYAGTSLSTQFLGDSHLAKLASGYVGMAAGCLAFVPPTIINQAKQTLNVNAELQNSRHLVVAQKLYQQKGLAGFYTGYWWQMASFGTCNALGLFFTSEIIKLAQQKGHSSEATYFAAYTAGYAAAGALTNPLELIKRQRQAAWANPKMFPDKSAKDLVNRLVKTHGLTGMYRGAHMYGLWAAARFGSAYATGDTVKRYVEKKFFTK